eukprot:TRINITY_DN7492_c0_g1_i2.p1 TRINITY_DN7492_c0_g1~~TRINITY_DN7492_c0_g1_i2.p1  ORF type:complete len:401 (+),score=71.31 TRINITY_DN7492_c0_g1_i2:963-2165(+)
MAAQQPWKKKPRPGKEKKTSTFVPVPMADQFAREKDQDVIDGQSMEGGGQILRNCTSLAAIFKRPIKIVNIRGKRSRPGLQAQHLTGITLVKDMYNGNLTGGQVDSTQMTFKPGDFHPTQREFVADIKTAGSVGLLVQVALPCLMFAPSKIKLKLMGGTNATMAPQIDYIDRVFRPIASAMGINFTLNILCRGYYPKGGGIVELEADPVSTLKPITLLDRGDLVKIYVRIFSAGHIPPNVMARMSKHVKSLIESQVENADKLEVNVDEVQETNSVGDGTGLIIMYHSNAGHIIAGSALGERGKPAEQVAEEAFKECQRNWTEHGCVDEYLQDQLILYMALANGTSKIRTGPLTLHTQTSIYFCSQITGAKFSTHSDPDDGSIIVECQGIGHRNPHFSSEQ